MASECCKTCNYFCQVRKHPTYQEVLTNICVFFLVQDRENYILETTENDRCECWLERRRAEDGK